MADTARGPRRPRHQAARTLALLLAAVLAAGVAGVFATTRGGGGTAMAVGVLPPPAAHVPGGPSGSGAYVGPANIAAAQRFGTWRHVPIAFASDYLSTASWHDIAKPNWWLRRWHQAGLPLILGVPMLPDNPATTIAKGAAGRYNHYFRDLARTLVKHGDARAALRIGWEMNGAWYRWSAQPNPAAWIDYYRTIVRTMRSVRGAHFSFDWNPNLGNSGMSAAAAYPGNAYVDVIGMDIYDWKWNDPRASAAERWGWIRSEPSGLDWLSDFAAAHHKPVALPEWSLAQRRENEHGGGGDDPYFVRHLLTWARSHHVAYEAYFNFGAHRLSHFPRAARAYRQVERLIAG